MVVIKMITRAGGGMFLPAVRQHDGDKCVVHPGNSSVTAPLKQNLFFYSVCETLALRSDAHMPY